MARNKTLRGKCPTCGKFIGKDTEELIRLEAVLKKKTDEMNKVTEYNTILKDERDKALERERTLETSNKLMEEELNRVKARFADVDKKLEETSFELNRLKKRSLWERILNKDF